VKKRNNDLRNSVHLSITSSLLEFNFLITLLLNDLKVYPFLNMRNEVSGTKQHVKLYITYLNHYGFIQVTYKKRYITQ